MPGDKADEQKRKLDRELDRELEATFPASDPLKITQPGRQNPPEPAEPDKRRSGREK